MSDQKPSVGRMVHYVSHGTPVRGDGTRAYPPACRAAVVTEVGAWVDQTVLVTARGLEGELTRDVRQLWVSAAVALTVHNPTGDLYNLAVPFDGGEEKWLVDGGTALCGNRVYGPGTWHWPARA